MDGKNYRDVPSQTMYFFPPHVMGLFVSSEESRAAEEKAQAKRDVNIAANKKAAADSRKQAENIAK